MATLGRERSLDVLNVAASDDLETESEDNDVFDVQFPMAIWKSKSNDPLRSTLDNPLTPNNENDETLINKIVSKHGPAPPQHSHNIHAHLKHGIVDRVMPPPLRGQMQRPRTRTRGSSIAQSETNSTSALSITSYSDKSAITPDQWMFIKHKMHGLAPILIEAINNGDNNSSNIDIDIDAHNLMMQHQDTTSELYVEDSDHSHPSDDEVLHDPRLMQNHTSSTITTPTTVANQITKHKSKKKHEYKASMTVSFDPNGYDHVVNALDVLQTFCTSVPGVYGTAQQQNQFDMESRDRDTDEQTNDSDDEVLHRDFDKNHHIEPEYSHDIGNPMHTTNKHSEYEQLRFNIMNSTISRSKSNNSKQSIKSKKKVSSKTSVIKDNDSENKHSTRTSAEKSNNSKHHGRVTPVPLNKRPKSKPKSKPNNITFSEILSLANNRNAAVIASPSSYLMPAALHGAHKPISPSQSVQSHTEISVDHADEYEYRAMADGGMKRISQSYAIPPIIAKNEDRMAGSREISTVDVILEEHENEYIDMNEDSPQQKDKNKNESVHQGVLLKQPSASQTATLPIASPTTASIVNREHRVNSLGVPQAVRRYSANSNTKSITTNSMNASASSDSIKEAANKMQRVYSKMESEPEDMMVQTSSFALTVESPQSGKYNEHNRENSMEVEYDERSAFKEDVIYNNTNYRHPQTYSNHHPHKHAQYGFAKKRSKHIPVDSNENYHLQNDEDEHEENEKIKSPKSKSKQDKTKTKRQYTQYAVRSSNSEKQPMNVTAMDGDDDCDLIDLEHEHMIIIHDNDGRTQTKSIDYLEFSNNKWTKWILLAALSICFILGVFIGFGVSWVLFGV